MPWSEFQAGASTCTWSLRYALRRLGEAHGDLGAHLDHTVRTGSYCSDQPDPLTPVVWEFGGEVVLG